MSWSDAAGWALLWGAAAFNVYVAIAGWIKGLRSDRQLRTEMTRMKVYSDLLFYLCCLAHVLRDHPRALELAYGQAMFELGKRELAAEQNAANDG